MSTNGTVIVIPMAGEGLRFRHAGLDVPKPLITTLDGTTLLDWATRGLRAAAPQARWVFVGRGDHLGSGELAAECERVAGGRPVHVIALNQRTRGQVETVLAAAEYVEGAGRVVIHNCDTYVEYAAGALDVSPLVDGTIPVFCSDEPHFSYVETVADRVTRVVEKSVTPERNATAGTYVFAHAADFLKACERTLRSHAHAEYYLSTVYPHLLEDGWRVRATKTLAVRSLGTPQELAEHGPGLIKRNLRAGGVID